MRYDPIMCMMVDDSVKTEDAKSYGKYKLPNGEIVEVIDRKNVHGADTIVYKNSRGVHFATVDWFMSNAKKVRDSASAIDHAIRSCDADKIIETIETKLGYGLYVIETEFGKRIVFTFPGETIRNPHMWLGDPTPSNISNAKKLFERFAKRR